MKNDETVLYGSHSMMELSILESKYGCHDWKCVKLGFVVLIKNQYCASTGVAPDSGD